jgi:hypothetical protein
LGAELMEAVEVDVGIGGDGQGDAAGDQICSDEARRRFRRDKKLPDPVDRDGAVCVVLRTGWHSTRGELVRMATSVGPATSPSGKGNTAASGHAAAKVETTRLLGLLLGIGVVAAVFVFFQPVKPIATFDGSTPKVTHSLPDTATVSLKQLGCWRNLPRRLLRASRVLLAIVPTDLDGSATVALTRLSTELSNSR